MPTAPAPVTVDRTVAEEAPAGRTGGTPVRLLLVLALLSAVAPLATDMYLPAFPQLGDDLGTSAAGVQLTLTAFLVGLGLGQLVIGPVSDAVGRRRPLLAGASVAVVASVVCALAPNLAVLTGARFLQGLGGASGVVLGRAIIADRAKGAAAARALSTLMSITVLAPVLAPLAGGAILSVAGWRVVLWALVGLAALMLVSSALVVDESLPVERRRPGGLRATASVTRVLLTDGTYVGLLVTFCSAFTALFAYISASPFVVQDVLGLSSTQFSLVFSMNAVAVTVSASVCGALAGRVPLRRMVGTGLTGATTTAALLTAVALAGAPTVPVLVLLVLFQGSLGMVFANTTAMAMARAAQHAGTGSAFMGFTQFALAAVIAPTVALFGETSAVPMATAMLVSLVIASTAFVTTGRRG